MTAVSRQARRSGRLLSYGVVVVALTAGVQAHLAVGGQGIAVLSVFIQRDFGLTRAEMGVLVGTAQLGACTSLLVGGWLGEIMGARRAAALGIGLIGGALLGLTTASGLGSALPFLLLSGMGNGFASPASALAILHWLPMHVRGTAMSVKQTGVPAAGVILAAGIPPLAAAFGWRAAAILAASSALLMAGLWLLIYRDAPGRAIVTRRSLPLPIWTLLRHPSLMSLNIFAAVGAAAQFTIISYLMLFLNERRAFPLVLAGQVLATAQFGALFGRIGWGLASDRLLRGRRKPALGAAGALSALSLVAVAFLPLQNTVVAFAVAVVVGLTAFAWHGLHPLAVAELVGAERAGPAIGYSLAMVQFGAVTVPPLFGLLVDGSGSYELAWMALAGALALSVVVMAVGWRERAALQ